MKYIRPVLIISLVVIPAITFAFSLSPLKPLGGKIITAPTPGVSCPAGKQPGSPFTVVPAGSGPSWLLVGDYHPISNHFMLAPNEWILGLYIATPLPECTTQSLPPVPVSGYRTFFNGTSR